MGELVYWNPLRPHSNPLLRRAPRRVARRFRRPTQNFGDLLAPLIVSRMLERAGIPGSTQPRTRLLTVGSILHLAAPGDVVWGTGRNGRIGSGEHTLDDLDIRAVRGPCTREWLLDLGVDCPAVFGDPAMLLPMLRLDLVALSGQRRHGVTFVSHIDDPSISVPRGIRVLSPRDEVETILRAVVGSELVVATSMHPVIVAEAFGVPARSIVNRSEPEFKFADHYRSTGRPDYRRASSVADAIELGGERPPEIDLEPLLAAFPLELFLHEGVSADHD